LQYDLTFPNNIINADCIKGMEGLDADSANLVFADPPYNLGGTTNSIVSIEKKYQSITASWDSFNGQDFKAFNTAWIQQAYRVLKTGGSILVWCSRHNMYQCGTILAEVGFTVRTNYVWYKTNAMPCLTGRNPSQSCEFCIWATKDKNWTYNLEFAKSINDGKNIRDVFMTTMTPPSEKKCGKHPSQKRLAGVTDVLLQLHTNAGDFVVVPFCGSGTECLAAHLNGRKFLTFELESTYIDLTKQRIQNYTKST
jgi:site-specific DNA-methyltransferase (adenine-specific)